MGMPAGDLERRLREDESAIEDDGFSQTVIRRAGRHARLRSAAVWAAGGAGSAVAVSSVADLLAKASAAAEASSSTFDVLRLPFDWASDPVAATALGLAIVLAASLAMIGIGQES
jgi:hypothetical protein